MREQFLNAMKARYACKVFDKTKTINKEDFNFILEAGRLSPSSFGFEPWEFLVVTKPERRLELTESAWGGKERAEGASHMLVVLNRKDDMKAGSKYLEDFMRDVQKLPEDIIKMKDGFFKEFQENDFNITENERTLTDWAQKQTYIAMGNMLTAAAYIGIDSCPIEGFNRLETLEILKEKFNVDTEKLDISYMLAFGYEEKPSHHPKTRRAMEDFVVFDK